MDINQKITSLEEGTIVLTSTERVARFVRMQVSTAQAVSGKKAWFSPGVIKTVTAWFEQAWQQLMPDEQLLFPIQELAVTKAITDSSGLLPDTMISSTSTARKVNKAFALAKKYGIPMDRDAFLFKQEYEAFFEWHRLLEDECQRNGWIFRAHLPELLLKAIERGEVAVPKKILIVGLLQLNPAEHAVFEALRSRGCVIELAEHSFDAVTPRLVRPHTQQQEFAAVANWVAETLKPYTDEPLAAPTMAIVVPDVRKYSAALIDALSLHAAPSVFLPGTDHLETKTLWDISSGASLGYRPVVRCAMDLLSMTSDQADTEVFSRVLRSPWIFAPENEVAPRAQVDLWLRDNLGLSMGGKDFIRALSACKSASIPAFKDRFTEVMSRRVSDDKRYPSEWADEFADVLKVMGWPGLRELDSANFQTLKAWDKALVMFRTLDAQMGVINYKRAHAWLREIVDTTQFQPRIAHQAPVAIMSYEEAIGLRWEKVWVIGASSMAIPLPVAPSPFIPTSLQEQAGCPESTPELSLERGKLVADALLRLAPEVVVSCPETGEKGVSIGQCELFGSWPPALDLESGRGSFIDRLVGFLDRKCFETEVVPPVSLDELGTLKGGTAIFKDYAEQPFFSMAKHRLGVREFPEPAIGLDPRIQGTMIHKILELFWGDVRTSWALHEMSSMQRREKIRSAVAQASEQLLSRLVWRYGMRLIQLEQMRLETLACDWIDLELKREFEFEVIGFENKHEIEVFGVPVVVMLDREDRIYLDDKREVFRDVVIDYKSGQSFRYKGLNTKTLTEPQLPIYATQVDAKGEAGARSDGIVMAQVNSASMGFHVRSNFAPSLVARKATAYDVCTEQAWDEQMAGWDMALQAMATGFLNGEAAAAMNKFPVGYEFIAPLSR